jgi:SAM-dependent methyltransferase
VREDYSRQYADLYQRHWWWRSRERFVLRELDRIRPDEGWDRILDVGCGDGLLFPELAKRGRVEGVEPDPATGTSQRSEGPIHRCAFTSDFDPGHQYGLILMLDVLEHLEKPDESISAVFKLLKPGGIFLLTVPAFQLLWTRHDEINRHRTRYRRRELEDELRNGGFEVVESRYFFVWVAVAKLVTRFKERVFAGEPVPPSLPPPAINAALAALSRLDLSLGRRGALPFGSSLLAIARRPLQFTRSGRNEQD